MIGEPADQAKRDSATILDLETALAKASKARADLRDPIANYHKFKVSDAVAKYPHLPLAVYFDECGLKKMPELVISQPEFFDAFDKLIDERPLADWITYLRWHVLRAPLLTCMPLPKRNPSPSTAKFSATRKSRNPAGSVRRASLTEKSAKRSASYSSKNISRPPPAPA